MKSKKLSKSEEYYAQARQVLVGGVNSPVRAFGAVGGTPRFIQRAKGPYVFDVDGNRYIDFVGSWGPMILGHAPKSVINAVKKALPSGTSFGAPTKSEIELAKLIRSAFPRTIEQLRFTNSGTEATMSALRLARAITKRDRILKFEGGYHGHSDGLLVSAGSGATTFGVPSSAGVPEAWARNTWVIPYNNIHELEHLFRTQGINIAAAIIEPVSGNMGVVPPIPSFLQTLRKLTKKYGSMLIFDEVMTGFRLTWGGAQTLFGIEPDITTLGKIIGGGFPVGAVGAKKHLMENFSPAGPVYQAGTLSGNPIAMAAGLATLKSLKSKTIYSALNKKTTDLANFIRHAAKKLSIPIHVNQLGSMFTIFFSEQPVQSYFDATHSNTKQYAQFFHELLKRGVYLPPSQFEAAFVSSAHSSSVMKHVKKAVDSALKVLSQLI